MITHLALDGVTESCLGIGIDIVGTAALLAAAPTANASHSATLLQQRVVSLDGLPARSGAGRAISVDGALSLKDMGTTDVLVVPGWFAATQASIEPWLSHVDTQKMVAVLQQAAAQGVMLAASCSATFMLAEAGVLDGQHATTNWWLSTVFARRFPLVVLAADRIVVEAPGVLTAGSAFAHADLVLAIIARIAGPTLAQSVARYLVLDHRASQSRYMALEHLRVSDPALQKVEQFILHHLDRQITLKELAGVAALSPRTLARRMRAGLGMTPNELIQRLRIAHATHLLDTTRVSVDEVAARVGYADPAAFRRVFRRFAGDSPRARRLQSASFPQDN